MLCDAVPKVTIRVLISKTHSGIKLKSFFNCDNVVMNHITLSAVFLCMYDILDCCCYGYVFPLLWYTILYKQLSVDYNREKHVHQRKKKKKHCYFLFNVVRKNENKKCLMFQTQSFLVESYRDFVCFVFVNVLLSQINKTTKSES